MVLCGARYGCEHCFLVRIYEHPRFKNDIKKMIEIYKNMTDPNYFPIDVVEKKSR